MLDVSGVLERRRTSNSSYTQINRILSPDCIQDVREHSPPLSITLTRYVAAGWCNKCVSMALDSTSLAALYSDYCLICHGLPGLTLSPGLLLLSVCELLAIASLTALSPCMALAIREALLCTARRWVGAALSLPVRSSNMLFSHDLLSELVTFFFPYNPPAPPIPTNPLPPTTESLILVRFRPFRVRFGPFRAHFGSVSGPFRVRLGVLGGVGVGSLRGGSVREKNITTLNRSSLSIYRPVRDSSFRAAQSQQTHMDKATSRRQMMKTERSMLGHCSIW